MGIAVKDMCIAMNDMGIAMKDGIEANGGQVGQERSSRLVRRRLVMTRLLTGRRGSGLVAGEALVGVRAGSGGADPHVRLGRYIRFEREAIEAWLRTRRRGPSSDPD